MKRYLGSLMLVFLVLGFLSFGCASAKKTVAKEQKPAATTAAREQKPAEIKTAKAQEKTKTPATNIKTKTPATNTNTNTTNSATQAQKESPAPAVQPAVTKSAAEDEAIEKMIKKYSTQKPAAPTGPRIAPDFNLQDIYYDTYRLSDYKGKQPVLLLFWSTQCTYCESELLILHGRYPQLVEDGLEVMAIDMGETMEQVTAFIRNFGIGYKVLVDTDITVSNAYRVNGVPTYILVDKEGKIVFQDNIFPDAYKEILSGQK